MCVITVVICYPVLVLDVEAFERLLGPCMDILKRNMAAYEEDMIRVFGGKDLISDLRCK